MQAVRCAGGFFFFSSRRRHTRLQGDWSSDVCSSDLAGLGLVADPARHDVRRLRLSAVGFDAGALLVGGEGVDQWMLGREHQIRRAEQDRKSTRLNSSHLVISYAVFCLKKKKKMIKLR